MVGCPLFEILNLLKNQQFDFCSFNIEENNLQDISK